MGSDVEQVIDENGEAFNS